VPEDFAIALPEMLGDLEAAPLLCAGVIGFRALRRAEVQPGDRVALMGFGASAHLALQVLRHWGCSVVVMTRGERHRELARELGADWVGEAADLPPGQCDRAVVFAPAGELVPVALDVVRPGGTVSLAGIHMSPIPSFDYARLWRERSLRSVANLTRRDAEDFLALATEAGIRATYAVYPLEAANDALLAIAADEVRGAAVLSTSA
jgi:propanol-preferring alcohol dehydrogenase